MNTTNRFSSTGQGGSIDVPSVRHLENYPHDSGKVELQKMGHSDVVYAFCRFETILPSLSKPEKVRVNIIRPHMCLRIFCV